MDPNNYREISLISCLSKLLERIVVQRLSNILEGIGLLSIHQSGFRQGRRTTDNLIYHTRKIIEVFNKKNKVLTLSFDIQAAFDSVWHNVLINKMLEIKIPKMVARLLFW